MEQQPTSSRPVDIGPVDIRPELSPVHSFHALNSFSPIATHLAAEQ